MPFARTLAAAAAFAAVAGLALVALAHDGVHDDWMHSLERPGGEGKCCNLYDCRVTKARVGKDGWEAQTQYGDWVKVPEDKIIRDRGNPTGHPVLCYLRSPGVLCFVMPPMG